MQPPVGCVQMVVQGPQQPGHGELAASGRISCVPDSWQQLLQQPQLQLPSVDGQTLLLGSNLAESPARRSGSCGVGLQLPPLTSSSSSPWSAADRFQPLTVDTSVEYEMPPGSCPPENSEPLLIVHPQYFEFRRHHRLQNGACTCQLCRYYSGAVQLPYSSSTAPAAAQPAAVSTPSDRWRTAAADQLSEVRRRRAVASTASLRDSSHTAPVSYEQQRPFSMASVSSAMMQQPPSAALSSTGRVNAAGDVPTTSAGAAAWGAPPCGCQACLSGCLRNFDATTSASNSLSVCDTTTLAPSLAAGRMRKRPAETFTRAAVMPSSHYPTKRSRMLPSYSGAYHQPVQMQYGVM